jgi:hypothetical protein
VLKTVGGPLLLNESEDRTDPVDVYDALVQFEAKARYRDPLLAFIETTDEIEARAAALAEATAALLDACQ